uniref:PREDICTED: copia proteinlike putative n=1 Tax=Albugo laibachii Nc14 TaxID=890382 RepID=F0WM36_9STRA|nr:PREDICTED: copia proteinlike putative [Albugo laibachii Nc14]|eukprot:CCA22363.1 PREDICTED: copia proteinlike putative [Albugo laibachii Nc14]
MHSSRHQLRSAQVEETYPRTDSSRLITGEICTETQEVTLEAFSDADYEAGDETRKSISGTAIFLNGMPMSCSFKRKHSVSLSTMEAEFVVALKAAQELLGARELFRELKITVKEPMILWMDNQATTSQQYMDKGIIAPTYVHTSKVLADLHTKALPTSRFLQLRELWQLRNWTLQVEDDTGSGATTKEGVLKGPKIRL